MSFVLYDLTFLSLFIIIGAIFLYRRRQHLDRQGLLYLYRTRIGLKIIENTSKKYEKILRPLQYLIILSGYVLMIFMVYALVKFSYLYLTSPLVAAALRVPILTPLFPYVDRLFGSGLLPPFYFTYYTGDIHFSIFTFIPNSDYTYATFLWFTLSVYFPFNIVKGVLVSWIFLLIKPRMKYLEL